MKEKFEQEQKDKHNHIEDLTTGHAGYGRR